MQVPNAQFIRFIRKYALQQGYTEKTRCEEYISRIFWSVMDEDSSNIIDSVGENERNSVDSCFRMFATPA